MPILELAKVTKSFGGLVAVNDVSFQVNQGEIFGLIGPNGAGKTTILNLITGFMRPTKGKIVFDGHDITGMPPHRVNRLGIGRTFQIDSILNSFCVRSSVAIAAKHNNDEQISQLLSEMGLRDCLEEKAGNLPHGHQKRLTIAMALATNPKVLLLDEPLGGMSAEELSNTSRLIKEIREKRGLTIILIEHNVRAVMKLCDRIAVLNFGQKIAEGTPDEVRQNEEVIKAYLGAHAHA